MFTISNGVLSRGEAAKETCELFPPDAAFRWATAGWFVGNIFCAQTYSQYIALMKSQLRHGSRINARTFTKLNGWNLIRRRRSFGCFKKKSELKYCAPI